MKALRFVEVTYSEPYFGSRNENGQVIDRAEWKNDSLSALYQNDHPVRAYLTVPSIIYKASCLPVFPSLNKSVIVIVVLTLLIFRIPRGAAVMPLSYRAAGFKITVTSYAS